GLREPPRQRVRSRDQDVRACPYIRLKRPVDRLDRRPVSTGRLAADERGGEGAEPTGQACAAPGGGRGAGELAPAQPGSPVRPRLDLRTRAASARGGSAP